MDHIQTAIEAAYYRPYALQFPVLSELNEEMRRIGGKAKIDDDQRSEIPVLAVDLFRSVQLKKQSGCRHLSQPKWAADD